MYVLINPNLVVQKNDLFTTGIVYMPIGLAYAVAAMSKEGLSVKVIDAFGQKPKQARENGNFLVLGLYVDEILGMIPEDTKVVFVYAINLTNHISTIEIIRAIKARFPRIKVVVFENSQAVTAYSLSYAADEFYGAGADYILTGEIEEGIIRFIKAYNSPDSSGQLKKIDGIGSPDLYNKPANGICELDKLPFPAWDMLLIENYWKLGFAHGPVSSRKYLPLLTSRGCPYNCKFCVIPKTNGRKWSYRSAKNVVDEIEYFFKKFGIDEFHIEDLNPTVSDDRIREICGEIIRRGLKIKWKIVAGTKVESIKDETTVELMSKSGCKYISISPETGSQEVLKLMGKPFDLEHAKKIAKAMNKFNIFSQACFVLGFPGETPEDLKKTRSLIKELTIYGIDEIALFIISPVPGSEIFGELEGYQNLSELNFSPTWRKDYVMLSKFRLKLYLSFIFWKAVHHPVKILKQVLNFFRRRFDTKMEMAPYRAWVYKILSFNALKK
jgi:radical SAM superfamily enzyme YgiQ (UPF0313 family)